MFIKKSLELKNHTLSPKLPGVYLFKDEDGTVLYVGKAKNLKSRIASYFQQSHNDVKTEAIRSMSESIDYIATKNDVEAMLLEAKLIRSYQPKFNILLKTGHPYLYLLFSQEKFPWNNSTCGRLKITRNKESKGTYFGPFLEKTHARHAYNFLIKTFKLKICGTVGKIPNGCLFYHLGSCAGACRNDFDKNSYLERLELAKKSLSQGHKKFLSYLKEQIECCNKKLEFEKSKELHGYHQAFEKVFLSLQTKFSSKEKSLSHKHIWIKSTKNTLFLFDEINGATKKKAGFYTTNPVEIIEAYYHNHDSPHMILTNFPLENKKILEQFLHRWHKKKSLPVTIITQPPAGHLCNLVGLAQTHTQQELAKEQGVAIELKKLLLLPTEPITIDCFDISNKQGMDMVGACVRFCNGEPATDKFRRFKIKTVDSQNDYAALAEIVSRRYKNNNDLPDLILIDGGKGQLNAVQSLLPGTEFVALAKREEIVFSNRLPQGKKLDVTTFSGQTLIRLRDYTHHFAISYHRTLAGKAFKYRINGRR